LLNNVSCPLTSAAARNTSDWRASFDIYLPEWLALDNKTIFGSLCVAVLLLVLAPRALSRQTLA
jgi:hypothetical protein